MQNALSLKNWMEVDDELIESNMSSLQMQPYLEKIKWITKDAELTSRF